MDKIKNIFIITLAWVTVSLILLTPHGPMYCIVGTIALDLVLYQIFISFIATMILVLLTNHSSSTILIYLLILVFIPIIIRALNFGDFSLESLFDYLITDIGKFIGVFLGIFLYIKVPSNIFSKKEDE